MKLSRLDEFFHTTLESKTMSEILSTEKNNKTGGVANKGKGLNPDDVRHALSFAQMHKLANRLATLKKEIEEKKFTWDTLAEQMTNEMGFRVTQRNLRTALKVVGIKMPVVRNYAPGSRSKRWDALRERVDALEARLAKIETELGVN